MIAVKFKNNYTFFRKQKRPKMYGLSVVKCRRKILQFSVGGDLVVLGLKHNKEDSTIAK